MQEKRTRLAELTEYFDENRIPSLLRTSVKDAYKYYLDRRPSVAEDGFLHTLPEQIRLDIIRQRYRVEIRKIHLFRTSSLPFVADLLEHSRPYHAHSGELLHDWGDVAEDISFIIHGRVRLYARDAADAVVVGYADEGHLVGDFEFYNHGTRMARAEAMTGSSLLSIDFRVLRDAIEAHPSAGARFVAALRARYASYTELVDARAHNKLAADMQELFGHGDVSAAAALSSAKDADADHHRLLKLHVTLKEDGFAGAELGTEEGSTKGSTHPTRTASVRRSVTAEAVDAAKMVWVDGVRKLPSELHAVELAVGDAEIFAVVTRKNGAYVTEEEPAVACRALYVLHPNDPIKVSWDVVVGVLICYTVASVPLQLAFADSSAGAQLATMDTFDYVIDGFFAGDVVLSFFTAYYDEARDVYVAVHKLIARRYLRTWFVIDVVSTIPFGLVLLSAVGMHQPALGATQIIKLFRLVRLAQLTKTLDLHRLQTFFEVHTGVHPAVLEVRGVRGVRRSGHDVYRARKACTPLPFPPPPPSSTPSRRSSSTFHHHPRPLSCC